ncbi:MAG: fibronectin type III domain-containing protein [Gemmatimonadales bacterium]
MHLSIRSLLSPVAALVLLGVAACGDDNGSGPSALAAPTGVTASQVSLASIRVSWTGASGATGYLVQRADASNPTSFAQIGGGVVTGTSVDDNVSEGVAYSYRVASVSASDTSEFSATVNFTTGSATAVLTTPITASRTLFSDTVYTLSGYVKVQDGATLTIQPGTRIEGDTTAPGSSLWILRGAKIDAQGTADAPIVFTSARSPGNRKPGDWGGIVVIGNGIINRTGGPILTEGGAAGQSEDYSGGNDNNDNSGTLRYVRIEFGGFDISNGQGQELNSLSNYAVGRGTTYEYIQTMSGLDDSFEYWGGAVDGRYLVSYESGDDHFDWTEGYQGRNQFLIALQTQRLTPQSGAGVFSSDPRGFEGDGCDPAVSGCVVVNTPVGAGASTPYSMPVWANFTIIGTGQLGGFPTDGNGAVLRRGTGGTLFNGIIARFPGTGLQMRDAWTDSLRLRDSLNITNLILAENGPSATPTNYDPDGADLLGSCPAGADVETCRRFAQAGKFSTSNHQVGTAAASLITSLNPASLDWTPKATAGQPDPTTGGSSVVPAQFGARTASFFGGAMPQTTYIGAADPAGPKWWEGWTAYNIN